MVQLTPTQERNLRAALAVAPNYEMRVRLAFAIWTESKAQIYANGGQGYREPSEGHTSWNWDPKRDQPIGTPESRATTRAILRRSLDLPHDAVGNNGRSTGMLQQLSAETGGTWGPMVGTMDPATSAKQFLTHLRVTDNRIYEGWLQTPTGREWVTVDRDPIAADVLRVQQPLANEARSSNYDASQVAIARAIVDQLYPNTDEGWLLDMADQAALDRYADEIAEKIYAKLNPALRNRTVGSQSLYDEGRYNTQDVLKPILEDIRRVLGDVQVRLLQPGKAWDNIQDIRGYWLPDIHAQLLAIEAKLGVDRVPNPGQNTIPDAG